MLRYGAGLPTELLHFLQNAHFHKLHPPITRRFRTRAGLLRQDLSILDNPASNTPEDTDFLEQANEKHKPIDPRDADVQRLASSALTHSRPPPLPPEPGLFEEATAEYTKFSHATSNLPLRKTPTAIILSVLSGQMNGSESGEKIARQLLREFRKVSERIEPDERFFEVALEMARAGDVESCVAWFSLAPSASSYSRLSKEEMQDKKAQFHEMERCVLQHAGLYASTSGKETKAELLQKFGSHIASRGLLSWASWTYVELSRVLHIDTLIKYWTEVSGIAINYANKRDQEEKEHNTNQKRTNRSTRLIWNKMVTNLARSGGIDPAAKWMLDRSYPFLAGIYDPYITEDTYAALLEACDYALVKRKRLSLELRIMREQLKERAKADYPHSERLNSIRPIVRPDSIKGDGLGYAYIRSMTIQQARGEISSLISSAAGGVSNLSATTLAGFIALCRLLEPDKPPWAILDLPALRPPARKTHRSFVESEDTHSGLISRLWIHALMLHHYHAKELDLVLATFAKACLPVGIQKEILQKATGTGLPYDLDSLYRLVPSRATIQLALQAILLQDSSASPSAVENLYQSFLQTSYGSTDSKTSVLSPFQAPDAATFQPFLNAFQRSRAADRCLSLVKDMEDRGIKPSLQSWTAVIGSYARQAEVERVFDLLDRLEEGQMDFPHWSELDSITSTSPKATVAVYTTVIKGFAMRRLPRAAHLVQKKMEAALGADEVEWHYQYNGQLKETLEFLKTVEMNIKRSRRRAGNAALAED